MPMTLRKQVLAGSAYSLAAQVAMFVAQFAGGIVLARLLTRDDFGIIAIAVVVGSFANILRGMGLGWAVIQKRMTDPVSLNTAFTFNLVSVLVLMPLIILVIAPAWGHWYAEPAVVNVVRLECFLLLTNALLFIPLVVCQVEMRFGVLSVATLGSGRVSLLFSVTLACWWRNYWALVAGHLAGGIALVVVLLWLQPYRVRLQIDPEKAAAMFAFGKFQLALQMCNFVTQQADKIIAGAVFDLDTLGVYFQSQKWGGLVAVTLIAAVQKIFFSAYSHKQDDRDAIGNAFRHSVFMSASLIIPCGVGLCLIAPDFVVFVLGEHWLPAVMPMRCFALLSILRMFVSLVIPVFLAVGRPDLPFRAALITKPILLVALIVFATQFGLLGVVAAVALDYLLTLLLFVVMNRRHVGLPLAAAVIQMRVPAALSLVMVPAWWVLQRMDPGLWRLGLSVLACAALYGALYMIWFRIRSLPHLLAFARHGPQNRRKTIS